MFVSPHLQPVKIPLVTQSPPHPSFMSLANLLSVHSTSLSRLLMKTVNRTRLSIDPALMLPTCQECSALSESTCTTRWFSDSYSFYHTFLSRGLLHKKNSKAIILNPLFYKQDLSHQSLFLDLAKGKNSFFYTEYSASPHLFCSFCRKAPSVYTLNTVPKKDRVSSCIM